MPENKDVTVQDWVDPDEIPDMSEEPWASLIDATPVTRGRPKQLQTKVPVSLRLDPDVVEAFKADGPGWQSRMNAALRKAAGV